MVAYVTSPAPATTADQNPDPEEPTLTSTASLDANRLFPSPDFPTVPLKGEHAVYPVHRIFCVGRNYAAHAKEMGFEADRDAPFYFSKTPLAIVPRAPPSPTRPAPGTTTMR